MLTSDLIRYDIDGETITPAFIDPDDTEILAVAQQLLNVFSANVGQTRAELLEASRLVINATPCAAIIARGLEKLLLDRTTFDADMDEGLVRFRADLFKRTSQLLQSETFSRLEQYHKRVAGLFEKSPDELAASIYSDLADDQPITDFKAISAERLLHCYNCALVQGLLFHCDIVTLTIPAARTESLRQLFTYLRFRQLLATIRKDTEGNFLITVSGPLSLFYQTRKYGVNLANFFTAVLHQQKWELRAGVQLKNRKRYQLSLSQACGIRPDAPIFGAYIPEDIKRFFDLFNERAIGWRIGIATDLIPLEGEFYCFADYRLVHESGKQIGIELFHPWHASHLAVRLEQLAAAHVPRLIVGVSTALLKNRLVERSIATSDYFSRFGFTFRETPTTSKVLVVLERVLKESKIQTSGVS